MKIRNNRIKEALRELGWVEHHSGQYQVVVGIKKEGDPGTGFHDFYYGPMIESVFLKYTKVVRPTNVSRSMERRIFKILLASVQLEDLGLTELSQAVKESIRKNELSI